MTRSTTMAAVEAIATTIETMGPDKANSPLIIAVAAVTALEDADITLGKPAKTTRGGSE